MTHDRLSRHNLPQHKCPQCGRYTMDLSTHPACNGVCVFCYGRFLDDVRNMPQDKRKAVARPASTQGHKVCNKCGVEKPFDQFSKRKASKDGLQFKCKECFKERSKKPEKVS